MKGQYRFLRTTDGKSRFARVCVDVQPGGETTEVVDALPERVDSDAGEINQRTAPTWVAAALEGIRATLTYARQVGVLSTGCRVALEKVVGTVTDTREDTVRCAAGLAVWQALESPGCGPETQFDGRDWNLVFPETVERPAQGMSR
jgi:hypothetical protein